MEPPEGSEFVEHSATVTDGPDRLDITMSLMEGNDHKRYEFPFGFAVPHEVIPRARAPVAINAVTRINGDGKRLLLAGLLHIGGSRYPIEIEYWHKEKHGTAKFFLPKPPEKEAVT